MLNGIDVSNANGRVDWDKLKGSIDSPFCAAATAAI